MVILIQLFVVSSEYNRWFTQWEVNGPLICCVNILFQIYNKPVSVIAVRAYFFSGALLRDEHCALDSDNPGP